MQEHIARALVTAGWANETFGSVEESGHFALLTVSPAEAVEVARVADDLDLERFTITGGDVVGNYIVREDDQGNVWLTSFVTPEEAKEMFDRFRSANDAAWGGEE